MGKSWFTIVGNNNDKPKVKNEQSATGFWAQDIPNFEKKEEFDRKCKLFNLPSKAKERELLYKWAPGTRRNPESD